VIDKRRARRAFERAAPGYDAAAVLQREIADRLLERLDYVRLQPRRILDLGSGTGYAVDGLRRHYRRAQVIALDFAYPMLLRARRRGSWLHRPWCLCADAERLPLADSVLDLIVSNATLQWCSNPDAVFAECLRVLRPGGLFLFSTFGPDTLKELRTAWSCVDGYTHVSPFADMHDLGDALVRMRFADPVMDAEHITLTYARLDDLLDDLKGIGANNATAQRPRGLTGPQRLAAVAAAYETYRREDRLPASFEVVYGTAWVPLQKVVGDTIAVPVSAITHTARREGTP
jgi:malonyl-CoA O-methyltransferase